MQFRWLCFAEFTADALYAMLAFRQDVLVVEQQSAYADLDFVDLTAFHLLASAGAELAGYVRCHGPSAETPNASLGRLVVARRHRGKGLGKDLVQRVLARLEEQPSDVVIGAQLYLRNFYANFGFIADGEPYDDVGVPHITMRRAQRA
jgi:ElaA protein